MAEVRSLPEVASAGMISQLPLKDPGNRIPMWAAERPPADREHAEYGNSRAVLPGYFEAMRIPILSGRGIEEVDRKGGRPVIAISQNSARTLFPGEEPLGRQVVVDFGSEKKPISFEVVGVVGDARVNWIGQESQQEFYYAFAQFPWYATLEIGVRSAADSAAVAAALRQAVSRVDKEILVEEVETMRSVIGGSLQRQAVMGLMVGFFGLAGLFLAAVGLYGLLSFHVSLRHHEIGIRMALGSSRAGISHLIIRGGMLLAGAGTGIGLLAAAGTARLLSNLLVGMGPFDPAVFLGAPAILLATALLACWIPARRAASLDPMAVLRME
jgi:predicted permease